MCLLYIPLFHYSIIPLFHYSIMIFIGVKNNALVNQKNIGFGLLSLTIFKILIIDLSSLNTNFKVFVFMLIGLLMLYISYVANKKTDPMLN